MGAPDHILTILAVSDLARAADFYEAVFGWPRRVDVPVYIEYDLPGGRGIGLCVRRGFGRSAGQVPPPVPPGEIGGTELDTRCAELDGVLESSLSLRCGKLRTHLGRTAQFLAGRYGRFHVPV